MRPKVVILVLVVAFGLLGLVALLKGVVAKNPGGSETAPVVAATPLKSNDTNTAVATVPGGSNSVVVSPEVRAALIEQEVAQIRELQGEVDGTNNPIIINALLDKFANPELEVRAAALQALKELNDTNALPGLERVAAGMNEPREKVAVLDAIDYIKLPSATQNVPPDLQTNYIDAARLQSGSTNIHGKHAYNPAFMKGIRSMGTGDAAQTAPAAAPANQPQ